MFNNYLHHWIFSYIFPIFSYFSLFLPYSLHVLSKKTVGMSGRGQAFGFYRFLSFWVFSSLWASWVVLAAVFWEVQGISNTPRLISPLGKSHEIVFNLAVSCSGFPNLSYFPLFRNISQFPLFLSFASKTMVSIRSLYVFEFVSSFWASWMDGPGSCPLWFLRSAGHLQYP